MSAPKVVVVRCADRPIPWVPAVVVRCSVCDAECWLSAKTGAGTIAAASALAGSEAAIMCVPCTKEEADVLGEEVIPIATSAAINEAFGDLN